MSPQHIAGKVLILGSDTRSLLASARSLGRGHVELHVASHRLDPVTLRSRYVAGAHKIPMYSPGGTQWRMALTTLMQKERFDLVIPGNDMWVTAIQKHHRDLARYGRVCALSDDAFDVFFNKLKTNDLARSLGIPVPRERVLTHSEEAAHVIAEFGFPVILKPSASFNETDPDSRHTVRKAYSQTELTNHLQQMLKFSPVAAQEFFIGQGVGVELLLLEGQPLLAFQHERVHEPLHGGGSSYRRSMAVSPHLLDAALRLLRPVGYTGVAMVEFRVNRASGAWALMEVNARLWGSLPLAVAAGADFPLALYELLVEGKTDFPQRYREGLYCRNFTHDIEWHRDNLRANHTDQTLNAYPILADLINTVINVVTLNERVDTFALDDPGPLGAEVAEILQWYWPRLRTKLIGGWLQSPIVRRKRAHRAAEELGKARTVLFVCKGNICRSPFAEHLARRFWSPVITVSSAGYFPRGERRPPKQALAAADVWGIDLAQHRSRVLTADMVKDADVIFVFDYEGYKRLVAEYGFAKKRLHFLGILLNDTKLFIDDPIGRELDDFKATYGLIARAIETVPVHIRTDVVDQGRDRAQTLAHLTTP